MSPQSLKAIHITDQLNAKAKDGEYPSPFSYAACDEFIQLCLRHLPVAIFNVETGDSKPFEQTYKQAVKVFPRQPSFQEFVDEDYSKFVKDVRKFL